MADLHRQLIVLCMLAGVSGCSHGAKAPRQPEPEVARQTNAPTSPSSAGSSSAANAPSAPSAPAPSSAARGTSATGSTYHVPSATAARAATSESPTKASNSSTPATLNVAKGHLPPPGMCRVWVQGRPTAKQPKPRDCAGIDETAPAGSWVLLRPSKNRKVVKVRMVDERRAGIVVRVRVYNAVNGRFLREERV